MKKAVVVFSGVLVFLFSWGLDQREPGSPASLVPLREDLKAAQPIESSSLKIDRNFGKMPVYFIPNRGQMDERVAFYVQGKDKTVYFADSGVTFVLTKEKEESGSSGPTPHGPDQRALRPLHAWDGREGADEDPARRGERSCKRWVVKLDFVGANLDVHPEGLEETGAKISYFKGKPSEWKTGLPAYSKLIYRDLWPGIDLVYCGTANRLKYEFIVHPGADPSQIRLAYRGAERVLIDESSRLQVVTPLGGFNDDAPVAYQEINGKRTDVKLAYRLDGEFSEQREGRPGHGSEAIGNEHFTPGTRSASYGFEVGDYDHGEILVLDPAVLIYSGYIGGPQNDYGVGIAVDHAGCAYVTGVTYSTGADPTGQGHAFPVTVGPDLTYNGPYNGGDAFVAKINSSGTALVYCGYIGGSQRDWGLGIAVDSLGCAYVTGLTFSRQDSFPVTVGPDLTYNSTKNPGDAFIAKVNASGTALSYCGYIGGADYDRANGIAVDNSGNAYLTGETFSTEATFPVRGGPDLTYNQGTYSYYSDCFVAKVNASGTALGYCGYIGGNGWEVGNGIAVDISGCAYIAGETGGLHWGGAYIFTFPVTVGPDLTFRGGSTDAFVAKVQPSGASLFYCGYIGRPAYPLGGGMYLSGDEGRGIAVDPAGCAYVVGDSWVDFDEEGVYCYDAFVAKIGASGESFLYDFIFSTGLDSICDSVAVDARGRAFIAGAVPATDLPFIDGPDFEFSDGNLSTYVAEVDSQGTGFIYGGYIGGYYHYNYYQGDGIAVDTSGYVYITGSTGQPDWIPPGDIFPLIVGPDLTYNGGWYDAYVAKVSPQYFGYNVFDSHDYDGDGDSDLAVFRPSNGVWYIRGIDNEEWGKVNDIPVPGDYNGDGFTDLAVWRPSDGVWYIRKIDNDPCGQVGDVPVQADYDGDGRTDLAVWRPSDGTWRIRYRAGGSKVKTWGMTGDFPVPGDYNGDGKAEMAVWRPSNGLWYIKGVDTDLLGQDGDIPVPADYDGDGKTDLAVWRPADGVWRIRFRKGGGKTKLWGTAGDIPVPGDYNGDRIADLAVWRPSTGQWLIHKIDIITWGAAGDIPLVR